MARSRYSFEVTEQDIADARVGDSFNCMTADAIKRQVPGARKVEVDLQTIRWSDEDGRHVFLTPYAVAGYIVAFDAGEEISPFEFSLRNPVQALQRTKISPAAKAVQRVDAKMSDARKRIAAAERVIASPESSPGELLRAEERIEADMSVIEEGKRERAEVRAAGKAAGMKTSAERTSTATRMPPPRVIKTSKREYGARLLRVNQQDGRTHTVSRDV